MPDTIDHREAIASALSTFTSRSPGEAGREFLATLGYESDRTLRLGDSNPETFLEFIHQNVGEGSFNEEKALVADWKSAELIFQLTDEELSESGSLFSDNDVQPGLLRSYLFFAIELTGEHYARGRLTDVTRQINRVFPMPVMVLIKHRAAWQDVLSIAVINRRQSKRDANRDVLGKVTIIRDIALDTPHRGHLDILDSFARPNLVHPDRVPINNFDTLHAAWEEIFNVELLNKRFYRELANWYFWALPQVTFPSDVEEEDEVRRATSLIRLLTRLIFCWFLKEKRLIPEDLFSEAKLKDVLVDLEPETSTFYWAILQNLFFATLNQPMGKSNSSESYRAFAKDEGFKRNRSTYGVDNLYRYEDCFKEAEESLNLFADVPFLNGGLFECLDRLEEGTNRKLYIDGFSRNKKKRPNIPNHLFFSKEVTADLSDAYGEASRRAEKVRGLLRILQSYKFTIVENTPIDQEIALDPELLGKVFENLLASYNEETKSTARKQTGSFYTPRPIVDYMVSESLKTYLQTALTSAGMSVADAQVGLEILFAFTEREHPFTSGEADTLLAAIHSCKVLDPACGSGAFPMGILQKLVYIIHKLDPDNEKWMNLQIASASAISDLDAREAAIAAIRRNFSENEDDYGRKLYLIENCLFGVDIQPIAIQISKLRFFISLVCDQRTNRSKKDNHGVRPLPNLETKFVSADALISLPELKQLTLMPSGVKELEEEISAQYHRHFTVQRRDQKLAIQRKVKDLRNGLAEILSGDFMNADKAHHVAEWDPFDPQLSADFFDPVWMFGPSVTNGFDIVIGNPPYMRIQGIRQASPEAAEYYKKHYDSATGSFDLYVIFIERGLQLINENGLLNFINPDKWVNAAFGKGIRKFSSARRSVDRLISFGAHQVFTACTYSSLLWMRHTPAQSIRYARLDPDEGTPVSLENELSKLGESSFTEITYDTLSDEPWILAAGASAGAMATVQSHSRTLDDLVRIFVGLQTSKDSVYFLRDARDNGESYLAYSAELEMDVEIEKGLVKPLLLGDQVHRYEPIQTTNLVIFPYSNEAKKNGSPNVMPPDFIETEYPNGWEYLNRCSDILKDRERGRLSDDHRWYRYIYPKNLKLFDRPKLIAPDISLGGNFSFDQAGEFYTTTTLYGYIKHDSVWESYEFLLAVLNSSVLWFYLKNSGSVLANGYFRYKPAYLKNFPIPEVSQSHEKAIAALACLLLHQKAIDDAPTSVTRFLEDLIDACVMECYFREHMAERELQFLDEIGPALGAAANQPDGKSMSDFISQFYDEHNAPSSPIRNRLLGLTANSPDLLAVIKEGDRS